MVEGHNEKKKTLAHKNLVRFSNFTKKVSEGNGDCFGS